MPRVEPSIANLVRDTIGVTVSAVLFHEEHLSRVTGVVLSDGRKAVVKVRPWSDRLEACGKVQSTLQSRGFPCAETFGGPFVIDDIAVTIEEYVDAGGGQRESFAPSGALSGRAFYEHVILTPRAAELPSLAPPPQWLGWDHQEHGLWPAPDDGPEDLNRVDAPDWLTGAARHVRAVLQSAAPRIVVGHGDWEAQNVFWNGSCLAAVHDWDSVAALPEAALTGAAGGVFGLSGCEPGWPSLEGSYAFLEEYLARRRADLESEKPELRNAWTDDDVRVYWAGGLWVHLFNAQKAIARGQFGPYADKLRDRVQQRLPFLE